MKKQLFFITSWVGIFQNSFSLNLSLSMNAQIEKNQQELLDSGPTLEQIQQIQQAQQVKVQKATAFMTALLNPQTWGQNKANINTDLINQAIDLPSLNFNAVKLTGIDFSRMSLQNINFSGALFNGCIFTDALLINANFSGCVFNGGTLNNAHVQGANFTNVNFNNFSYSSFYNSVTRTLTTNSNLRMQLVEGIDKNNYGIWFDFERGSPIGVIKQQKSFADQARNLSAAVLVNRLQPNQNTQALTILFNYYQSAANILSDLIACMKFIIPEQDFSGEDLSGGCFRNVKFAGTVLSKAQLNNADFRGANVKGLSLQYAKDDSYFYMQNMRVSDTVWLPNNQMSVDDLSKFASTCTDPAAKTIITGLIAALNTPPRTIPTYQGTTFYLGL